MSATSSESGTGKIEVMSKYQRKAGDTGSSEVQVALLTSRIQELASHFEKHPKDRHSQRGLMSLISRRKRLLKYLSNTNIELYRSTIASLGLRK